MSLVHNGLSSYKLLAAHLIAARLVGLTEAAKRLSERSWLTSANELRDGEDRSSWNGQSPGSVFDARYKGLTAHAAFLDAAICRQEHLR
jgi:hypothetical protein